MPKINVTTLLLNVLLIIGALAWGFEAYTGKDLVKITLVYFPWLPQHSEAFIKYAIAAAGILRTVRLYNNNKPVITA